MTINDDWCVPSFPGFPGKRWCAIFIADFRILTFGRIAVTKWNDADRIFQARLELDLWFEGLLGNYL